MNGTRSRRGSAARRNADPDVRPKAVLFCPDCGHESPPDGAWHRRRLDEVRADATASRVARDAPEGSREGDDRPAGASGDRAVVCPECGAVATIR